MLKSLLTSLITAVALSVSFACTDSPQPAAERDAGSVESDRDTVPATPAREVPEPGVPLPELVRAALEGRATDVIDRLNDPLRVEADPHRNRHDPSQIDTIRTLIYEGLQLRVYDIAGAGGRLLSSITVTGQAYRTETGIHVGSPRTEVLAALGAPAHTEDDTAVYELGTVVPNTMRIHYDGDTVSRLEWDFYVD